MSTADRALTWPFFVWLAGIGLLLFPHSYDFPAVVYAVKTVVCAGLVLWFRPWRYVPRGEGWREVVLGLLIGVAIYALWAAPESTPWPAVTDFYRTWFVMMPGTLPDYSASWCYAFSEHPVLAIIKLIGSAFVIAPIEEYFFRGWFMRWMTQRDWQTLPLRMVSSGAFWGTAVVFALEHDRFVGGFLAGVAYGGLAVKTGNLRASIVAHVTTNLLLALQVLLRGDYHFW